jgi:transcription initiation factor TFIID subunit 2
VDPVALGIPMYFDIIPRKDARDLRTIRQKLDADKYDSVEAFEADIDLMVRNAIKFNGAESEVGHLAINLQNRVRQLLVNAKTGTAKKRKEGDGPIKGASQPLKKVKVG